MFDVLTTLRQPRYYGLMGACLVVAIVCALAGTWQIARFNEKRTANHALRANNADAVTDVATALGPAASPTATGRTAKFRHIRATGQYLADHEVMVQGQTVGDSGDEDNPGTGSSVGFLVLTPFRTSQGVLLVVRGFIEQTGSAADTPKAPAPPSGTVTIEGRLQAAEAKGDKFGRMPDNQVDSINVADNAERLAQPVYNGYAELLSGQPGSSGLTVIPNPSMSNPAGGAAEPQHAAYVVQWYLFAGLALALPFVLAAAERRREAEEEADRQERAAVRAGPRAGGPGAGGPGAGGPGPGGPGAGGPESPAAAAGRLSRRQRREELADRLAGRT